ncbi:MFS transporter [candidate division KSB1 bacterium]|nr:MFS transporter [candidate division KSB1 bacterium]
METKTTPKTIRILAWASFFNDFGSDMIYPIWPLFVTTVLKANMTALGLIDGVGEAVVSISKAISGYHSDKIQRRKVFVWVGYLLGAGSRIGYALVAGWQQLLFFRILDRAGKIRSAPRDAMIADASTESNRGRNFGLLRTMDHLGALCGILICMLCFKLLGYRTLFFLAAIPSIIGAGLIYFAIKEDHPSERKIYKGFSLKDLNRDLKFYLFSSSIFTLGAFSYSFLLIFAKEYMLQIVLVPVLYLIFTAVASLTSLPFGKWADQIGRKPVLLFSLFLWALVCLGFMLTQSKSLIFLIFIGYGLHKGALEPVQKTLVSELAPPQYRASILGAFQMVLGICALPASLLAGFLWETFHNPRLPFSIALGFTLLSALLLFFVREPKRAA